MGSLASPARVSRGTPARYAGVVAKAQSEQRQSQLRLCCAELLDDVMLLLFTFQVPYNCLDWANRHAVAKAVRIMSSMFCQPTPQL